MESGRSQDVQPAGGGDGCSNGGVCTSPSAQYVRVSLHTRSVRICRPVYDQASFDRQFQSDVDPPASLRARLRSVLPGLCSRSTPGAVCRRAMRYLPVVEHLRNYRWASWLLRDIVAGLSSGVIHVPQV